MYSYMHRKFLRGKINCYNSELFELVRYFYKSGFHLIFVGLKKFRKSYNERKPRDNEELKIEDFAQRSRRIEGRNSIEKFCFLQSVYISDILNPRYSNKE